MLMLKIKKKGLRISNLTLYWSFFSSNVVAVKGLRFCSFEGRRIKRKWDYSRMRKPNGTALFGQSETDIASRQKLLVTVP